MPRFAHGKLTASCVFRPTQRRQSRYKDPIRGDVSFAIMMAEKEEAEEREKNPKAGSEPGCPGCKN